jgi:hypothetical protein
MKDIEIELGLDKSILAAKFTLGSMAQRFTEANTPIPLGLLSQMFDLLESLEEAFESRYPNCDHDVRVGLTSSGIQEVLDEAQKEERTLLSVIEALSNPTSSIKTSV